MKNIDNLPLSLIAQNVKTSVLFQIEKHTDHYYCFYYYRMSNPKRSGNKNRKIAERST